LLEAITKGLSKAGIAARIGRGTTALAFRGLALEVRRSEEHKKKNPSFSIVLADAGGGERIRWRDTPKRKVEELVAEIAVEIAVLVEDDYRRGATFRYRQLLEEQAANIEAARLAKIETERQQRELVQREAQKRLERLIADAEDFHRANSIRSYVAAVANIEDTLTIVDNLERWRLWALSEADRIDPVTNGSLARSVEALEVVRSLDDSDEAALPTANDLA
jgi:uncharacterized membrane-anchored protein YjiN (DUF445 family)